MITKLKYNILCVAWLALAAFGCGSGASSPTSPAQIPTSIEYGEGSAIITGALPASIGNTNLAKSATISFTPTKVYVATSATDVVEGTLSDGRFYVPAATGQVYALIFTDGENYIAYQSSALGLHSIPLTFVQGAASDGVATFEDGTTTSTDVNVIDIGEIQFLDDGASNIAAKSISLGKTVAQSDKDFSSSLCYANSNELTYASQFDSGLLSISNKDTFDHQTNITVAYDYSTTETNSDLVNNYSNPDTFHYDGYTFYTDFSGSVADGVDSATLSPPVDIQDKNGNIFAANDPITSCYKGSSNFSFFCTGIGSSVAVFPVIPPTGSYIYGIGTNSYTMRIDSTSRLSPGELNGIPLVIPMMIVEDGYIKGVTWKWMTKDGNSWKIQTRGEVASVIKGGYGGGYFHLQFANNERSYFKSYIDGNWNIDNCDSEESRQSKLTEAAGSYIFSEHGEEDIPADQISSIHISYNDISGYSYGYQWSGFMIKND